MDVIGVVIIEDKEVLVSAAERNGELVRLVRVDLTRDSDANRVYMLAS